MPIPEGYLPRTGDVVVLHAVVKYDVDPTEDADSKDGLQVWVTPMEYHSPSRVPLNTLVGLYSRHFEAEERVRLHANPRFTGIVIATHDDVVWVKPDEAGAIYAGDNFPRTFKATLLEPLPDVAEEPPVDTSDIPETPKSFFENATLVENGLRVPDGE
jgi:hypothetical protein